MSEISVASINLMDVKAPGPPRPSLSGTADLIHRLCSSNVCVCVCVCVSVCVEVCVHSQSLCIMFLSTLCLISKCNLHVPLVALKICLNGYSMNSRLYH